MNAEDLLISDSFTEEVCDFLNRKDGIHTRVGYNIAGLLIDILVEKNHKYFGIDLVGYPVAFRDAFTLERYKILNRVGIEIMPISYLSWKYDEYHVKDRLEELLTNFD
ncbi:MAG: hypothetical protein HRT68_12290 [Flavobacteriaceae bacterium]|nr:hypothetical protein [Flavobacteriaceae bacterium]